MPEFKLNPAYTPTADQPGAIAGLAEGLREGERVALKEPEDLAR